MKLIGVLLLLASCIGVVKPRASVDLSCPEQDLVVRNVAERTVSVEGCGRRAVYVYSVTDTAWKIDGTVADVPPPATPQPPAAAPAPSTPVSANPTPSGGPQ
ncbi:MAG: hypothetical protein R3B48_07185 [Kofleriaceae bacterium]